MLRATTPVVMGLMHKAAVLCAGATTLLTACPGTLDDDLALLLGDVGPRPDATAQTEDAGPDCDYVVPEILSATTGTGCAVPGCHGMTNPRNGLDLESPDLVGRLSGAMASAAGACAGEVLIDPANPSQSLLFTKVAPNPSCGDRMPFGLPLDDADIACVLSYIESQVNAPGDVDAGVEDDAGVDTQLQYIEAEDADTIRAPFMAVTDAAASGGEYISQPTGAINMDPNDDDNATDIGLLTFNFTLSQTGLTQFWALIRAATNDNDSFYVRIDGGAWIQYNNIPSGSGNFVWDDVHDSANENMSIERTLDAGNHTLDILFREADTQLDRILISQDTMFTPT